MHSEVGQQTGAAVDALLAVAQPAPGDLFVLGGSTSEIVGARIGSSTNAAIAHILLAAVQERIRAHDLFLAVQCCEHLNRCLVVERPLLRSEHLTEVTVIPVLKAGGALAATAMELFEDPVVVASVAGHLGMDIGDTFIGMHLRPVVVPVRIPIRAIGDAHLTLARTRPPLVGGHRAQYPVDAHPKGKMSSNDAR